MVLREKNNSFFEKKGYMGKKEADVINKPIIHCFFYLLTECRGSYLRIAPSAFVKYKVKSSLQYH